MAGRGLLRRILALSVLLAFLTLALLLTRPSDDGTSPELTASNPVDRAALQRAPAGIDLTFSVPPDLDASHVSVVDESGASVNAGPLRGLGNVLRQPMATTATGNFAIAYHVEFHDGGQAQGVLRMSIGTGVPPPAHLSSPDPSALADHQHEIDPLSAVLLVIDAAVVLGVGIMLMRRPRRPGAVGSNGNAPTTPVR